MKPADRRRTNNTVTALVTVYAVVALIYAALSLAYYSDGKRVVGIVALVVSFLSTATASLLFVGRSGR